MFPDIYIQLGGGEMARQTVDKLLKLLFLGWIVMTLVLLALVGKSDQPNRSENARPAPNVAFVVRPRSNTLC